MGGVNRNLTHTSIDEIEIVGPKSLTGVTVGKDKELESWTKGKYMRGICNHVPEVGS